MIVEKQGKKLEVAAEIVEKKKEVFFVNNTLLDSVVNQVEKQQWLAGQDDVIKAINSFQMNELSSAIKVIL